VGNDKKRRDSHEIVAAILESARNGAKKTHIMNKAKISYTQTEQYLPLLVEKGFLVNLAVPKRRRTIRFFKTSDLGRKFLENLSMLEM
jgi:predicted transcriptional regulator